MIKVSIFSFPIFGEFNKLLADSVFLCLNAGSNYFPRLYMKQIITGRYLPHILMREVINSRVYICGK